MQEFPEIDCAEWFTLPVARTKINEAQAAFFEVLLRRLEGSA
jgi:predicted NUDIX family NTP pyrophosphohydrolase